MFFNEKCFLFFKSEKIMPCTYYIMLLSTFIEVEKYVNKKPQKIRNTFNESGVRVKCLFWKNDIPKSVFAILHKTIHFFWGNCNFFGENKKTCQTTTKVELIILKGGREKSKLFLPFYTKTSYFWFWEP